MASIPRTARVYKRPLAPTVNGTTAPTRPPSPVPLCSPPPPPQPQAPLRPPKERSSLYAPASSCCFRFHVNPLLLQVLPPPPPPPLPLTICSRALPPRQFSHHPLPPPPFPPPPPTTHTLSILHRRRPLSHPLSLRLTGPC